MFMNGRMVEDGRKLDRAEVQIINRLTELNEALRAVIVGHHDLVLKSVLEIALAPLGCLLLKN